MAEEKFDVEEFMKDQPDPNTDASKHRLDEPTEDSEKNTQDHKDPETTSVEEEDRDVVEVPEKDEHPTEYYKAETRAKRPPLTGDDIAGHYVQPTTAFEANKGSALPVEQRDASGNVVGLGEDDEKLLNPSVEVTGYRRLSQDEISWMNTVKRAEIDLAAVAQNVKELGPDVDSRMWAMARTHFQTGFMLLNRAIAKPEDPFDNRA